MGTLDTSSAALILTLITVIVGMATAYLQLFLDKRLALLEKAIILTIRSEFATKEFVVQQIEIARLKVLHEHGAA